LRTIIIHRFPALVDFSASVIDKNNIAKQCVELRLALKHLRNRFQRIGSKAIIRIENYNHVAGGLFHTFVHRVVMALVLFRLPDKMRIASQDINRSIPRSPIDPQMLPCGKALIGHAFDGLANCAGGVKARCHHRNPDTLRTCFIVSWRFQNFLIAEFLDRKSLRDY
jgi:hypothetical protein